MGDQLKKVAYAERDAPAGLEQQIRRIAITHSKHAKEKAPDMQVGSKEKRKDFIEFMLLIYFFGVLALGFTRLIGADAFARLMIPAIIAVLLLRAGLLSKATTG